MWIGNRPVRGCIACNRCGDNPWGTFLDVKTWPEVKDPSKYKGKELFLSSVTDPYQPHEAKYKRTQAILEQMQGSGAVRQAIQVDCRA